MIEGKRVFVAGHKGMVGHALVRRLDAIDCELITADRRELDLTDAPQVTRWFEATRPQVVFLAAARVGGIAANASHPVAFLQENLQIELNTIAASAAAGTEKFIMLGSSCIYPKHAEQPIREDALLTGPLEPTNEWYAVAKIAGIKLCQAYRKEFGRDFISVMPCNLYGIHDNFDLATSHVLPALIRKAHEAKQSGGPMTVWGTGRPRRELLFADDAADAIVFAAEHYSEVQHLNIGYGSDIPISELVNVVCEVVGYCGDIVYDTSKPDGTPRKLMDSSRLFQLGWRPRTPLQEGIAAVYQWYCQRLA